MRRKISKTVISFLLAAGMALSPLAPAFDGVEDVYAQDRTVTVGAGSYSTEVRGTWSYVADGQTVTMTNASLLEKLPYPGSAYRHTTENYTGPVDTSDWATSFLWDLTGQEPYSHSVFAIPFAYKASRDGMMITNPSTIADNTNGAYSMFMPEDASLTDFVIQPEFATSDAKVDKITDWTYDVVMQNSSDASQYMKTTMVQGSPFAYFQFENSNKATIVRKRNGLSSSVAYYNGDSVSDSNILILRVYDNADGVIGYEDYDYYAIYAPEGTTFTVNNDGAGIGSIEASFPAGRSYFTFAILCSTYGVDDDEAKSVCNLFRPYAYNFVTDTKAEYSYDEKTSIVSTTYSYSVEKKAESGADGTLMGILPHQYKNMQGGNFLDHTYRTIRGTMKLMAGSSFTTKLTYSGFIPYMPDVADGDMAGLQNYVTQYMTNYSNDLLQMGNGSGDTYWTGKALNRVGNVLAAAETCNDTASADKLYAALKTELEDWFTTNDTETDKYFYYDSGIGSLFGFPQSFNSVDQMNDHHFHYGYYIYAAAQIALRDPQWGSDSQYGGIVKEIIGDIACNDRNSTKYPYLRNFAPYEGHSWASGHQAFADGNNHESSSEALNAWAGIIMFGEATGNKELRDLGIYLYTTEISAVNNYWFDVEKNVLDDRYRYGVDTLDNLDKNSAKVVRNQASMVWGGKYVYGTWWTAEPLQVQGINLLPMNPASFYLAGDQDYIKENLELALYHEENYTGPDKMADPSDRWNDIWSEYEALADPDYALSYWDTTAAEEGGESRAHTYHYIMSLKNYGTPDTSISSDTALSTVFDKDGIKTYAVFNAEDTSKTVTFSDGIQIVAAPHKLTTVDSANMQGVARYTVEYYKEKLDGSGYDLTTETKQGMAGARVTADIKVMDGFSYDRANSGNVTEGLLTEGQTLTLKLYYRRNTYTLQYDLEGGELSKENPSEYKYGQSFEFEIPTKSGYVFNGWYTDEAYKNKITGITATTTGNLILRAKFTDASGYEVESGKKVECGGDELIFSVSGVDNIQTALVFFKAFDTKEEAEKITAEAGDGGLPGNALADDGTGTWIYKCAVTDEMKGKYIAFRYNVISNGVGVLSKWGVYEVPTEVSAEVVYKTEHYKEDASGNYVLADTVTAKAQPDTSVTANEKIYTGYTLDESHADTVKSGTVENSGTLVLKLYYKRNTYEILYQLNGGTNNESNPASYRYGDSIALSDPVREGYAFGGWYTAEDFAEGTRVTGILATAAENYVLFAKWSDSEPKEPADYTIKYYKQNTAGTGYELADMEKKSAVVGTDVTAPVKAYTGFTYNGSAEGNKPFGAVTADGALELALYYDRNTYTISYVLEGGTNSSDNKEEYVYGVGASLADPVKAGYTFLGWYEDEAHTKRVTEVSTSAEGAKTLYAAWRSASTPVVTHSITYIMNGGENSAANPNTYEEGVGLVLSDPEYEGHTFLGWYLSPEFEESTKITEISAAAIEDYIIYARWEADGGDTVVTHRITYILFDGLKLSETFEEGRKTTLLETPVYEGHTFLGWYLSPEFTEGTEISFIQEDQTADLTVYAKWMENKTEAEIYKISYVLNGGTNHSSNPSSYTQGTGAALYAPSRNGYVFDGWYADSRFAGERMPAVSAAASGDITLYAKWKQNQQTPVVINLVKSAVTLKPGKSISNISSITGNTGTVSYRSSDQKVATVNASGVVKAIGAGKTTITVSAGGVSKSFVVKVSPKKMKKPAVSRKSGTSIKIKWKKTAGADGYQVAVRVGKKGKFKIKNIKGGKKTSYTRSKLKGGSTCYVKVRAYKKIDGQTVVGDYSAVRKYKLK